MLTGFEFEGHKISPSAYRVIEMVARIAEDYHVSLYVALGKKKNHDAPDDMFYKIMTKGTCIFIFSDAELCAYNYSVYDFLDGIEAALSWL